jgi:hypothetical protein
MSSLQGVLHLADVFFVVFAAVLFHVVEEQLRFASLIGGQDFSSERVVFHFLEVEQFGA